jgi:putative endonuclease
MSYWVYILTCNNDSYYIGYTTNLPRRYKSHQSGSNSCKYTRSFKPLKIAQCWEILGPKTTALQAEHFLKKLSRVQKTAFILKPATLKRHFPCEIVGFDDLAKLNLHNQ